ncbi:MAG: zinc dependent phospholipase C family protein, partial [Salibacteraceae bacterium]
LRRLIILVVLFSIPAPLFCWGFFGHKKINRIAVFTLPTELMGFYKDHIEFVTEHAVDPDMRRYVLPDEAPRHYIDIDHYGEKPFDLVPRNWYDAVEKFTEDTLQAYGIVPWHIDRVYRNLVYAFRKRDWPYVLKLSADLGHYIGDAHVPLHTTKNYNGQLTNQRGIHGFWESRLPELYSEGYDYFTGTARVIPTPLDDAWDAVEASHSAVDSVLMLERELTERFPKDRKYAFDQRGASTVKTYSRDFSAEYHIMLNGMVERRMRRSIIAVGSFWYSAWVEAGKPDLEAKEKINLEELEEERKKLEAQKLSNEIKGREHDD